MRCSAAARATTRPTVAVAGVEDVVPALLEQRGGLLDGALHDDDGRGIEVARHQPGDRGRGGGRELGGLHDHAVAGAQGGGHRGQQQLHRVVPRRDHQRDTERLADHVRLRRLGVQRRRHLLRAHPRAEVLEGDVDLVDREADLGDEGLARGLAEVGEEGGGELALVLGEQLLEAFELLPAPGLGPGGAGGVRLPQSRHQVGGRLGGGRGTVERRGHRILRSSGVDPTVSRTTDRQAASAAPRGRGRGDQTVGDSPVSSSKDGRRPVSASSAAMAFLRASASMAALRARVRAA